MMSSFFSVSSSSVQFRPTPFLSSPSTPCLFPSLSLRHVTRGVWGRRDLLAQVNCVSDRSEQATDSKLETSSSSSSLEPSSSSVVPDDVDYAGIAAYKLCAGLGGIGFLETAYLTYLKFTNSDAFCPLEGGSCTTILTSEYSSVFGIPLPLFGMLAYGLVTTLSLQLGAKERTFDAKKTEVEIVLIGISTSMAVASAYFLYILRTEFGGELCLYCLLSAVLSFSLFLITVKRFGTSELLRILGLQLVIAGSVVVALTTSYSGTHAISSSMTDTEVPYFETEVTKESSPLAIALAKHLHAIGAKLYGAFWCSHCLDQKEMFGREAAKILDYVECFPDGVTPGTKMAQVCSDVKLEGFPTWLINGQIMSGEKELPELAALAGIKLEDLSQQPN